MKPPRFVLEPHEVSRTFIRLRSPELSQEVCGISNQVECPRIVTDSRGTSAIGLDFAKRRLVLVVAL